MEACADEQLDSMDRPPDFDAPLFAYGALKPGEFAHAQVAKHVSTSTLAMLADHGLRSRDGLPLLVESPGARVRGALLRFDDAQAAYEVVCQFEPRKHYRWAPEGVTVVCDDREVRANALLPRKPRAGADLEHVEEWYTADDPVFTAGLPAAAEIAHPWVWMPHDENGFPWEGFFRVQAAYLLLWSVVERVAALRFGPALDPMRRINNLGDLPSMRHWLAAAQVRMTERRVVDSRDPGDGVSLRDDGSNAWGYWYQIRNNLSHRGKGSVRDRKIVNEAFIDVHDVTRLLLLELVPNIAQAWTTRDAQGRDYQWRLRGRRVTAPA